MRRPARTRPTIAVDFDGVIHAYRHGWQDGTIYDEPMPGAAESLRMLIDKGFRVVIHSSRASTVQKRAEIMEWLDNYDIPYHDVTNLKPAAIVYLDDRALKFDNWNQAVAALSAYDPLLES